MAATELDIANIVQVFREIVKRKTTYNETNLHYEYFKRVGDTIPFKTHGYDTLRELLEKNAGDVFYFEKVGNDLEFIAPKRIDSSAVYSKVNKGRKLMSVVKKVENSANYGGSDSAKRVRVSNNICFGAPQSTGLNNPFQNVRNDIKISFNFDVKKREVDQKPLSGIEQATESECLANKLHATSEDEAHSSNYLVAHNKIESMSIDDDDDLPWDDKYWHLKITHAVSSNEIWARFFDEFEVNMFYCSFSMTI